MSAHHGNTPAAWTGVSVVLLAFVVAAIGLVGDNMTVFWVGVALGPIGLVAGMVMSRIAASDEGSS